MAHRSALAAAAALVCTLGLATLAAGQGLTYEFTPDGAWNWLADPRAFYVDDTIIAGWVSKDGDVQCGSFALWDGSTYITDLAYDFEQDDHDYPAFLETSDGRYTAFFSKHANYGTYVKYRTTNEPGDITSWTMMDQIPYNLSGPLGATYPNPWMVPGETDQAFVFWRAANFQQAYSIGTYAPGTITWTWTPVETLILNLGERPYVKYDSFGSCRIALAFTNGHPDHTLNNIYYAAIGRDSLGGLAFFRADGSKIKNIEDGPLEPSEPEVVFDRTADPDVTGENSWIWDVSFDREGRPVIAFATFPSRTHHQYHWARFDGNEWDDQILLYEAPWRTQASARRSISTRAGSRSITANRRRSTSHTRTRTVAGTSSSGRWARTAPGRSCRLRAARPTRTSGRSFPGTCPGARTSCSG